MATPQERLRMAGFILDFEARRDKQRRLKVYKLPRGDGGGAFEVAGINERYHPAEARLLADLIDAGRYDEAEKRAHEFIAAYTDVVADWTPVPALECYLRDCAFNRGPKGAARILQRALSVADDGIVGPITRSAIAVKEQDAPALLNALRIAREQYERDVAHRHEASRFWKGLVNRWNKARDAALTFPCTAHDPEPAAITAPAQQEGVVAHALNAEYGEVAVSSAGPALIATNPAPVPDISPSQDNQPAVLRALRCGSRGDLVYAWQAFLLGRGFDPCGLDGVFGPKTGAATRAFQSRCNLTVDGIAGRRTFRKAMQLGFELIEEPGVGITGSDFPTRPSFHPLTGTAARQAVFGAFRYAADPQRGNREHIRVLGNWERDHIVMVPIPQLRRALGQRAPAGMRFHRLAAGQLQALWQAWEAAGLLDRVCSFDGAYVPRFIRGSRKILSNHAFGSAFDINAARNPLGARPALVGRRGSVRELAALAANNGFFWGGHFSGRPDGMHFEIALLNRSFHLSRTSGSISQ